MTKRVLDEMYVDPFWTERFGTRGRGHAETDGDFHVKYVVSALESTDPALFATYARWLRDVLVARGMCSRHLEDNFERLSHAIDEETTWDGRERAMTILRSGGGALAYLEGDAKVVDAQRAVLDANAVAPVMAAHPAADRARVAHEAIHLLSFLADGLAIKARDKLAPYVHFLVGSHERRGIAPIELTDLLAALAALPDLPETAREIVEEAR